MSTGDCCPVIPTQQRYRILEQRSPGHSLTELFQNIVLAERPPVTTTISSLPQPLLDALIPNLSTLSSVYQKLPSSFLVDAHAGTDRLQQEAIDEAVEDARDNPIAASAVAAAMQSKTTSSQPQNAENLLDIDFDGAAPASLQKEPAQGASGLEGLAGTPQRVLSPVGGAAAPAPAPAAPSGSGMDDLMGTFDAPSGGQSMPAAAGLPGLMGSGGADLLDGFAALNTRAGSTAQQPPPARNQLNNGAGAGGFSNDDDLLG